MESLQEHALKHLPETTVLEGSSIMGAGIGTDCGFSSAHLSGSGVSRTSPSKKSATVVRGRGRVGVDPIFICDAKSWQQDLKLTHCLTQGLVITNIIPQGS